MPDHENSVPIAPKDSLRRLHLRRARVHLFDGALPSMACKRLATSGEPSTAISRYLARRELQVASARAGRRRFGCLSRAFFIWSAPCGSARVQPRRQARTKELQEAVDDVAPTLLPTEVCERMKRNGGTVFPARANTGRPVWPGRGRPVWPGRGLAANEIARTLISMMPGEMCSNQRPDTLMQDRTSARTTNLLATSGRTIQTGQTTSLAVSKTSPLYPGRPRIFRHRVSTQSLATAIMSPAFTSPLRRPVTSITASAPTCKRVPAGRASRLMPRVVTFSPMAPSWRYPH
jgi:hypothetical protein